ncbi:hypothetical protein ATCC90586_008325 [Pythium insidiosum]|nr:hypothetical protein ATCC90586_008325 [Pythium insidiosum]
MALRHFLLALLAVVYTTGSMAELNVTELLEARRLAPSPGYVAVCYTPFHNGEYPLGNNPGNVGRLRAAIEADFELLSQHVTHVRTFHAMHYGIEIAPIAAKYGLKLYLGVFMTKESWRNVELNAAANAIKYHSDTVEAVLVGNENLFNFYERSWDILNTVNEVKALAGADAWRVKYGTVQRLDAFLESKYDWDMGQLNSKLDILGVNIYPFFDAGFRRDQPAALLDRLWNLVVNKYPREKVRLTETGYPTAGSAPSWAPNNVPSLEVSYEYYNAVAAWTPSGSETLPKFWFQAFDRRPEDPMSHVDHERFFGFFKTDRQPKRDNFPRRKASGDCGGGLERGVDYWGNDIGSAPAASAEACFAHCRSRAGCRAFTWSDFQGGMCWLKWGKTEVKPKDGVVSALLEC